ncbi:hypothetical protein BU24DRAFT_495587 [Aaosphaeria arxii CBS 175.79]|uniref:Zn(2)-C6 fungal-type domain-containing protein n=1 Tax=Aaosphaeria arxii CBS 175.79 TaxID=1450172 RepID=A0A6A5XF05_9PLEO|nr:uncharacterized protein BU24DRAFT_495587 [Aaosphaeria arxii CBS 175.79]KAF2011397.1 hypothetical protein BU24DRAFT_495587 [Aaosphaeria arxii CBS 175.79]
MVYRGKPSAACGECRKRRNRCDQAIPTCGQCRKAKRNCPGYRNQVDLMFFDESEEVAKRSQSGTATPPDHKVHGAGSSSSDLVISPTTAPTIFPANVLEQTDDLGLNFFMANYVGSDSINSQFIYLPEYYAQSGYKKSDLCNGIQAVGLVGYARATGRSELVEPATRRYITVIKSVNKALSEANAAQNDSLLLTILFLAMFEVMVRPHGIGLQNVTKHLNGALSMALLRLKEGQQTPLGRKVFGSLYQSLIMNCWIQNIPLPADIPTIKRHMDRNSMHSDFLEVVMMMMRFRHDQETEQRDVPSSEIAKALALDQKLRSFTQSMPREGQYKTISMEIENQLVFDRIYHVYPTNFTAHLWNNIRTSRMRIHMVVVAQSRVLLSSPERYQHTFMATQLEASENIVRSLARDICATVPQLAGYIDDLRGSSCTPENKLGTELAGTTSSERAAAGSAVSISGPQILTELARSAPPIPTSPRSTDENKRQSSSSVLLNPKPASQCQLLYQLCTLSQISLLPIHLRHWVNDRIEYVKSKAEPEDLQLLEQALEDMPSAAFPFFVNI